MREPRGLQDVVRDVAGLRWWRVPNATLRDVNFILASKGGVYTGEMPD